MSATEISVLMIEDDSMVRGWVRLSLEGSEFRIAGEATSGAEALDLIRRRAPRLLLVDHRLPDGTGTELIRSLRHEGIETPAVLMTAQPERGLNESARDAGAQGSVLKTGRVEELFEALRAVSAGRDSFDTRHPPRAKERQALSPREREVLRLVASGETNRQIAGSLEVGEETVKTLVARIFMKLGVRRRAEAVSTAHDRGLL